MIKRIDQSIGRTRQFSRDLRQSSGACQRRDLALVDRVVQGNLDIQSGVGGKKMDDRENLVNPLSDRLQTIYAWLLEVQASGLVVILHRTIEEFREGCD
jgi:hypothetical protein